MTQPRTYRLGSSPLISAPGVVAWAVNGYAFESERDALERVISDGWNLPISATRALLTGEAPFKVEGETVVFTYGAAQ